MKKRLRLKDCILVTENQDSKMIYKESDYYSKKALKEGYEARSVYKLAEIQSKNQLIKKNQKILDLGCAPGSWSQLVSKIIGDHGLLVGIDYKKIIPCLKNAVFIHGNFLKKENQAKIQALGPFDGIISDMAPDTTGDRLSDCYQSSDLVWEALCFCGQHLKKGGFFIAKIFQGGDEKEIMNQLKKSFKQAKWFKPKACRKNSFEIFLIGIDYLDKPCPGRQEDPFSPDENQYTGEMPW